MSTKRVARKQPNAVQRYFRETVGELRKVSWPTRQEAINLTKIVLIVVIVSGTVLGVLDIVFGRFFGIIFGL